MSRNIPNSIKTASVPLGISTVQRHSSIISFLPLKMTMLTEVHPALVLTFAMRISTDAVRFLRLPSKPLTFLKLMENL
jgi:hypothetical protein